MMYYLINHLMYVFRLIIKSYYLINRFKSHNSNKSHYSQWERRTLIQFWTALADYGMHTGLITRDHDKDQISGVWKYDVRTHLHDFKVRQEKTVNVKGVILENTFLKFEEYTSSASSGLGKSEKVTKI
jgi:hypothetical protein